MKYEPHMMYMRYEWVATRNSGERKAEAKAGVETCFPSNLRTSLLSYGEIG
jgi:hypothetical protein